MRNKNNVIRNEFLPALIGRTLSDMERRMVSLPVRLGGLGISDPVLMADGEYQNSRKISNALVNLIVNQVDSISDLDSEALFMLKKDVSKQKSE